MVTESEFYNMYFHQVCVRGDSERLKQLIIHPKYDPTYSNNIAIGGACVNGHKEVIEILLKDGRCDPSVCKGEILRTASERGYTEVVELLEQSIKERSND